MSWDWKEYTKIGQSDSVWLFSKIQQDSGMAEAGGQGGQGGRTPPPPDFGIIEGAALLLATQIFRPCAIPELLSVQTQANFEGVLQFHWK